MSFFEDADATTCMFIIIIDDIVVYVIDTREIDTSGEINKNYLSVSLQQLAQ